MLRENNLCLLANFCVYKCKKHYNPRYIYKGSFIIYPKFWDKVLEETQTLKAYWTESYKYCIIIAGSNTEISKTHRLLNKILLSLHLYPSICLLRLALPSPSWQQSFFSSLSVTSDHFIVSLFWFEMVFSKLSLPNCHFLHNRRVYCNFNLRYFMPSFTT